jgi:hypothetical protein
VGVHKEMKLQELLEASKMATLKKNKKPLSDEERTQCMKAGAVWHHGPHGEETPAIWKSVDKKGKTTYVVNTHRAYQSSPTMKGAIAAYPAIEETS